MCVFIVYYVKIKKRGIYFKLEDKRFYEGDSIWVVFLVEKSGGGEG